jgi:hypothetical protein
MRLAFYAPLKPPDHPVPSGDRLMARQLLAALAAAGHDVALASDLRAFLGDAGDAAGLSRLQAVAAAERARIAEGWRRDGAPDGWFCYHPYYKAPDLLGPPLCAAFRLPYVTAETSYSGRRNTGIWAAMQAAVLAGARQAALNICLTARDARGLAEADPAIRIARMLPFIAAADAGAAGAARPEPGHLVTVAMMRPGDKLASYRALAAALAALAGSDWRLSVAGDGPARAEVAAAFEGLPAARLHWHGALDAAGVAALLARGSVYVWPGVGEGYGLAYLEAQAAGLPVVAFATAGVPEVVHDGETGFLVPDGDTLALAAAIGRLLASPELRRRMGMAAAARVRADHALPAAAAALRAALAPLAGGRRPA